MTTVTIKCPITWYEQCDWIYSNCKNWVDRTYWSEWQIGYDDIYFELEDQDAILFLLRWS
jgi:hypothetical protein